jgi:hypothetical protein
MQLRSHLPHERERLIKQVAEHYKQRGYSVGACCRDFETPSRIAGLIPHVQLMMDELGISVIEVVTKETIVSAETVKRLQAFSKFRVSLHIAYPEELGNEVVKLCGVAKLKTVQLLPLTKEGIFGL